MRYLIDTDISSYFLRGRYNLNKTFEEKGFHDLRVSRITVAELEVLAIRNPQSKINLATINSFSQKLGVIEVDQETWRIFSEMKAMTLNSGQPRGDFDILNASVAKQYNLVLVTNNTSHYENLVEVENWTETSE